MAKPLTLFRGSMGLNVLVDPVRIAFDPQTGVQDLAVAYNIDHDRTGRISRRKGFAQTDRTENVHSLWCDGGECLFVTGTSLCVLDKDYAYTAVATVTANAKVSYLQFQNRAYWMNGFEKGYIENGLAYSWGQGAYVGPATKREFTGPPTGTLLRYRSGRVYIVQGPIDWYGEPYSWNLFDLTRSFWAFEDNIVMIRFVQAGCFIGTENKVHFVPGGNPDEAVPVKALDYGVIAGTDCEIDAQKIGNGQIPGTAAMWTSPEGICVAYSTGGIVNLTQDRLEFPSSRRGSAICIKDRYISLLEP
jgi:hypothetical protein